MALSVPGTREAADTDASRTIPLVSTALMAIVFGAGFTGLSLLRHAAFQSHAFDLGNMDQAVWNVIHGNNLRFTDMESVPGGPVLTNRFAIHVEPLLYLLAPLYLIHPGPETLLVTQALVVATGTIPAYLLAAKVLRAPWPALAFPLAYLLHPSLQNAVLDDFHAVTLSAALLLWALYFGAEGKRWLLVVTALLAIITKEEVGLVVALLGAGLFLWRRERVGLLLTAGGVLWFLVAVMVIIPHFNPGGQSPYLARYAYLGKGMRGVIAGAVHHPSLVARTLTAPSRVAYLDFLFRPLGYVSLLGFPVLLAALPPLLINMLSSEPTMYSGLYQYSAEIVPLTVAAAIAGIAIVLPFARRAPGGRAIPALLCALVVVASAVATRTYGFSPLAEGYVVPSSGAHQQIENRILARIPAGAVVSAGDEIEPHLSDRRTIYLLPTVHPPDGPAARYIVLDASIPSLPVVPATLRRTVTRALHAGFRIEAAQDGILLLRHGAGNGELPRQFFTFALPSTTRSSPIGLQWHSLELVGATVHPGYGWVNRSRPAIEVETYWRSSRRLPGGTSFTLLCSPVFSGALTVPPARWQRFGGSPTTVWFPANRWPVGKLVRVASMPCIPPEERGGRVAVGIEVTVPGISTRLFRRLGTIDVRP